MSNLPTIVTQEVGCNHVNGHIAHQKTGEGGFGYDPIFIPEGYEKSFAVLPDALKNTMSHRFRAVDQMRQFLEQKNI